MKTTVLLELPGEFLLSGQLLFKVMLCKGIVVLDIFKSEQ